MSNAATKDTRPKVDDDLDDLDDVLNNFNPTPKKDTPSAPATPGAAAQVPPNTATKASSGLDDLDIGTDFARELAEGMAALMREIAAEGAEGAGADGAAPTEEDKRREAAFRKVWEDMLVEGLNGEMDPEELAKGAKAKAPAASGAAEGDKDKFQSSILKAMEQLKVSETSAEEEKPLGDESEVFENLLASLGAGGAESEEQLEGILEGLMTQLMSKDLLYEPLKELRNKFPGYLAKHATTLSSEQKTRYEAQQKLVVELIAAFDDPAYDPENQEMGIKIVTLMNAIQSYGSPPPELMGPLPPGLDMGPDGLPKLPEGCTIQ